jgi:hypothetical protein
MPLRDDRPSAGVVIVHSRRLPLSNIHRRAVFFPVTNPWRPSSCDLNKSSQLLAFLESRVDNGPLRCSTSPQHLVPATALSPPIPQTGRGLTRKSKCLLAFLFRLGSKFEWR